jgi:hypothetical protein
VVVGVSLRSDRRGRVPFALVGVVLLLGSLVYATGLGVRGPVAHSHAVDTALDRAEATARTTVRVASRRAVRAAASQPVVVPANTTAGRLVSDDRPFGDTLAIRTALTVADALGHSRTAVGEVHARSRLPPLGTDPTASAALSRVTVEPTANDTAVRVTVRNLTHTAHRDRRQLARRTTTVSVVVHLPVFAVHDRVQRYERRLNRGPVAGPGLGRQLTAELTALAEARGLAQYSGVGVENVIASRHVAVASNGGALRLQRATFGHADPAGRAALVRATAKTALTDLMIGAKNHTAQGSWARELLTGGQRAVGRLPTLAATGRSRTTRVGVNGSADAAYVDTLEQLDSLTRRAYRGTVTREVGVVERERGREPPLDPPGVNWTLGGSRTVEETTVVARSRASSARDSVFDAVRRRVRVRHTETRVWTNGTASRQRRVSWSDYYTVLVVHRGGYDPNLPGPARVTRPVFTHGGAFDGPNLVELPQRAGLPLAPGTVDDLALAAVSAGASTDDSLHQIRRRQITVDPPEELRAWLLRDLIDLRERVRELTVTVADDSLVGGEVSPASRLRAVVRERRRALLDPPRRYRGVADRLRVTARAAFLTQVQRRLADRAGTTDTKSTVRDTLADALPVDSRDVQAASEAAADSVAPEPEPVGTSPGGEIVLVPHADPSYLTVSPVSGRLTDTVPLDETVTPLATRNVNAFTVPFDDAGDVLTGWLSSESRRVSLGTAGRVLAATNETLATRRLREAAASTNETAVSTNETAVLTNGTATSTNEAASVSTLRSRRRRLVRAVRPNVRRIERRLARELTATLDSSVDRQTATAVVTAASDHYDGLGARARAAADGRYAETVALAATRRLRLSPVRRDEVAVRLRVTLRDATASEAVTVPAETVEATVDTRRRVVRHGLKRLTTSTAETRLNKLRKELAGEAFDTVVAGLPVAPVPGYWYATVNVWYVAVRGEYPQFVVSARRGEDGASVLRYVRENSTVRLDTDGDGERERLGYNRPVSFRTHAVAVAVVPPGKSGVGDVDGNADERSGGWACPGGPACDRNRSGPDSLTTPAALGTTGRVGVRGSRAPHRGAVVDASPASRGQPEERRHRRRRPPSGRWE